MHSKRSVASARGRRSSSAIPSLCGAVEQNWNSTTFDSPTIVTIKSDLEPPDLDLQFGSDRQKTTEATYRPGASSTIACTNWSIVSVIRLGGSLELFERIENTTASPLSVVA